jgi:hypothetical protein
MSSGAGRACFVDEALCAALGAGVSPAERKGTMVLDIGGGVTNCSVVALGNIAISDTVNIGGNDFTKAIIEYIAKKHKVEIGTPTAEDVKMTIGAAVPRNVDLGLIVCGKNTESGFPVQVEVTADEIYGVLKPKLDGILSLVLGVLENTSPELCGDIAENGIILTGGSANLYGIDSFGEAIEKARKNTEAAGLFANYINRDFFDFKHEYLFDELITDMPFLPVNATDKNRQTELEQLYRKFFVKAKEHLKEDAVMVLYVRNPELVKKYAQCNGYRVEKEFEINKIERSYVFVLIKREK